MQAITTHCLDLCTYYGFCVYGYKNKCKSNDAKATSKDNDIDKE